MKKVMVIGSPGAGKSTFSRRLQKKTNLPIVYLDQLFWKSDKTTVSPEEFTSRLKSKMQTDTWIMDGNYSKYMFDERLSACDTVFFLDYDVHACLKGVRQRRGKKRPDMPWIEKHEDKAFMDYIRVFPQRQKPKIMNMLAMHPDVKVYHFKDREEVLVFLNKLN
ncbi:adenylate kinase [Lactobacillus acidophilus]|uniref:adenylate kinase n=1 Tax=Lactobacillus acidophilus TaxID=1579 RepID=UPI0021A33151|nr:adenylate kinase [Lactobacillus acidophilus]MCT3602660.1 adenylate kinase [Lactobacillus acidophilus]MCT3623850.1 adenylate kinase [Lactobacillus acidophilus]